MPTQYTQYNQKAQKLLFSIVFPLLSQLTIDFL